eukprot:353222-Chlamydomonas_euryale.AAC.18
MQKRNPLVIWTGVPRALFVTGLWPGTSIHGAQHALPSLQCACRHGRIAHASAEARAWQGPNGFTTTACTVFYDRSEWRQQALFALTRAACMGEIAPGAALHVASPRGISLLARPAPPTVGTS